MTRLDDIRQRVKENVERTWDWPIDPDIPYLLDLVERAVWLIEDAFRSGSTSRKDWEGQRDDWLRDVRGAVAP